MVEKLKDKLSSDESFRLIKVLKAGSNAKFTSLRRTEDNVFDVDLGAYYSGEGATKERLGTLLDVHVKWAWDTGLSAPASGIAS